MQINRPTIYIQFPDFAQYYETNQTYKFLIYFLQQFNIRIKLALIEQDIVDVVGFVQLILYNLIIRVSSASFLFINY